MLISKVLLILMLFISVYAPAQTGEKIQSGSWSVNQSIPGYSLDNSTGERIVTLQIKFDVPFEIRPEIILSVAQLDAGRENNLRYKVEAASVSRDGFTVIVRTWSDSRIFSISGYWAAISG